MCKQSFSQIHCKQCDEVYGTFEDGETEYCEAQGTADCTVTAKYAQILGDECCSSRCQSNWDRARRQRLQTQSTGQQSCQPQGTNDLQQTNNRQLSAAERAAAEEEEERAETERRYRERERFRKAKQCFERRKKPDD